MRVAIVGSRNYPDLDQVRAYVESLPAGTVIVTGGARGVDRAAEEAARWHGLVVEVYYPDYAKHSRRAPLVRNHEIAKRCDRLVAFLHDNSRGTVHVIGVVRKLGKAVTVHEVKQGE